MNTIHQNNHCESIFHRPLSTVFLPPN